MPKQISIQSTAIEYGGAIQMVFGQDFVEDDELIQSTPLRYRMEPNEQMEPKLDDLDSYLELNKWPKLTTEQRQSLIDFDAFARANPDVEAQRAKWIEDNPPPEPGPPIAEPQPEAIP